MRSFLFLFGLLGSQAVTIKDCSSGTSFFKIVSLSFTPDAPVAGQNGTLHSVYDVPMGVNSGTAKYTCALNGLPFSTTYDLCSQTACPITAGTHDDYSTSTIPDVSGKLVCTIEWRDSAGSQLLCIQTDMRLATATEKKSLRGKLTRNVIMKYQFLFGNNLSSNKTLPVIKEFDPTFPLFTDVTTTTTYHTHDNVNKKALITLPLSYYA